MWLVSSLALGATPYRRDSWDAVTKTGIGLSPDDKLNSSSGKTKKNKNLFDPIRFLFARLYRLGNRPIH